jgi:hypothetical protein
LNRLRQLQTLTGSEQWLLLNAILALPFATVALKLVGLKTCQRLPAKASSANSVEASSGNPEQIDEARRIARVVSIAGRHGVYHANCLPQSLVLWWLLRRRSIASEIRFGARKEESELTAHAWVECDGLVLNEADDVGHRFAPFNALVQSALPSTVQQDS